MPHAQLSLAVLSAALLLAGCSEVTELEGTARTDLNVRACSGTRCGVVGTLRKGERVRVARCADGWCELSTAQLRGFSAERFLVIRSVTRTDIAPPPVWLERIVYGTLAFAVLVLLLVLLASGLLQLNAGIVVALLAGAGTAIVVVLLARASAGRAFIEIPAVATVNAVLIAIEVVEFFAFLVLSVVRQKPLYVIIAICILLWSLEGAKLDSTGAFFFNLLIVVTGATGILKAAADRSPL